ncbi:phosphonatase-like hydrolase [Leucobacter chromiireducens]|uniref:phosphonatase-like hydrolase n=1 Tax=Leucobacter chromiireducens TaxID=283877 RepID=UPI000F640490|nr:phosphonatase-like hydrolase [Leucobacter chromiireducens]
MITLAVFDMAGTTIDDGGEVYRALEDAVTETGATVAAADLQAWMGTEKRAAITALMRLGGGDPARDGVVDRAFERFQQILAERYAAAPPTAIPGVPAAIAELRARGVRVALTTGFSRDVAAAILDRIGWRIAPAAHEVSVPSAPVTPAGSADAVVVDALVCGDEVLAGRPAPYMIQRAMELTGTLDVRTVLVAGDTAVDVQAGAHAGAAHAIGVLTGKLGRADFPAEATAVLAGVAEVPAFLAAAATPAATAAPTELP